MGRREHLGTKCFDDAIEVLQHDRAIVQDICDKSLGTYTVDWLLAMEAVKVIPHHRVTEADASSVPTHTVDKGRPNLCFLYCLGIDFEQVLSQYSHVCILAHSKCANLVFTTRCPRAINGECA